jgi:hypothetical protein
MGQWRVGSLGKAREPLFIPGIEPVVHVVRGEKNVKIRIERTSGQLHEQ